VARERGIHRGRALSKPRATGWNDGTGGTGISGFTASGAFFMGNAFGFTADGFTIVRQRGLLRLWGTLATAPGDGFVGAFGIGLATTAAVVAGVAAVPTPITEQDDENWMFWHAISVHNPVVSSTEIARSFFQEVVVDVKAMRKVASGMSIYSIIELVETGTATMSGSWDSRMLTKLP